MIEQYPTTIAYTAPKTAVCISATEKALGNADEPAYDALLSRVRQRFQDRLEASGALFTTDVDLWPVYIDSFPSEARQHYNCHACRHFLRAHGGLVTIGEHGEVHSAIWNDADAIPEEYSIPFAAMRRAVERAKVTGVFLTSERTLGHPLTGVWRHLHLIIPEAHRFNSRVQTAGQKMAEKTQDYQQVQRALSEFSLAQLDQAVALLETDSLYRAEKVIGPVKWLRDLQALIVGLPNASRYRSNVVWRAIATAPAGFCHPRSSMAGSLLEDIAAGKPFDEVARAFKAKMHPLQYQRPQASPSEGAIDAAEKVVEKLGIAPSLKRRFARLDECECLWKPAVEEPKSANGVFGHLRQGPAKQSGMNVPAQKVTWTKFARDVLPAARGLEASIGHGRMMFSALVTAADPDAPPIIQWDREDLRNPVSWYLYSGGSPPIQWNVKPGWATVNAVVLKPHKWGVGGYDHQGNGALFVIDGARDSSYRSAGAGLFPEILKSDLHGVRSVIERYSRSATIDGYDQSSACGLMYTGTRDDVHVRVTDHAGNRFEYVLDRWD